jgi:uncharacterized membrane protein YidH (DUF202 family)
MYTSAESLAAILVAFPIFLLISRAVRRDEVIRPEKLNSPVRKWLTYMVLVIAAGVFIGDLINALTYFLRGEITSRFLAKSFVVLVISGSIFFYYFGGLRRSDESEARLMRSRDAWMAALSSVVVAVMLILGFSYIGKPSTQRALRADAKRVQDLNQLSGKITGIWNAKQKLPEHLDELADIAFADPISRVAYEYHVAEGSHYEICAIFELASNQGPPPRSSVWSHPSGRHCFVMDATQTPDNPYIYNPD